MEMIKSVTEVTSLDHTNIEELDSQIRELGELELMFVGGGQGDILLG